MLTDWEAVTNRISCRSYQSKLVSSDDLQKLKEFVDVLRQELGLNIQLVHSADLVLKLAGAMFSGEVHTYAVLSGKDDALTSEKLGYFGQKLVLYATALGLGTCWVAGTYNKKSVIAEIPENEKIWDVIPIGYPTEEVPMKQKMIRSMLRKKDRKIEQFVESETPFAELPEWVKKGTQAVLLGPSAVNQQPVNIVYKDGRVSMKIWKNGHGLQHNDMGIANRQFEVGASECGVHGSWQWNDGGEFIITTKS